MHETNSSMARLSHPQLTCELSHQSPIHPRSQTRCCQQGAEWEQAGRTTAHGSGHAGVRESSGYPSRSSLRGRGISPPPTRSTLLGAFGSSIVFAV